MSAKPWQQRLAVLVACGILHGCSRTPVAAFGKEPAALPPGTAGVQRWRALRRALARLRARHRPASHYRMNVRVTMRARGGLATMGARGVVAVAPQALRMILLGPGGTTALDVWSCGRSYRFAVPPLELVRRSDGPQQANRDRDLPIDFLRYWFLRPLQGRLLFAADKRWVLREGDAHTVVHSQGDALRVERVAIDRRERLHVSGKHCGRVTYRQPKLGLQVEVACERLELQAAPARAFADPDDPTRRCQKARGSL